MLYSHNIADNLLGCYLQDPSLTLNSKYPLEHKEFQIKFQEILYVVIHNLALNGCKTVSIMDIEQWIQPYQSQYNVLLENNYDDYIATIVELVDADNFEYYYEQFRKFSCLNEYKENGFDIKKFYDEDKSEDSQLENLNQYSVEDIINHFDGLTTSIRRQFHSNWVKEEYVAGTDFMESKERFKESPLVGNSFQSPYLNSIFRGMYGFIIRGAKSGGGKTVVSIGDLCKATITEYYDYKVGSFVKNKSRKGSGLFINTELDLRDELDPIIISWISGVPRNHIIDGKYDVGEEDRVNRASQILLESELYIVDDPEFNTKSLVDTIKDYAFNKNVQTICFDYIQNNGFVAKEISNETKVPQREDMVLLALTDRLKQVQRECGVSLISAVQTNGNEDNVESLNESCLAGGKSQVRKTDGTMIMLYPTKKELTQLEVAIARWNTKNGIGLGEKIVPNNVVHIIKGRGSKYKKNTKVFQYVDLSTSRTYDMFCTDRDNNLIDVEKFIIEYE